MPSDDFRSAYLRDIARTYRNYKALGDRAIAQAPDADLHTLVDPDSNSIAIIVKHLAGNLRSRFTDFLTTDGEKADRNRDGEFEPGLTAKAPLLQRWEEGWRILFAALDALKAEDLTRTVLIRGERLSALDAINRQLVHYGQHVGQIVYLAKHHGWQSWKSLSVPRRRPGSGAGPR